MKSLAVSIVLALGLSAPALAQTGPNPPADATAADVIDENLIFEATTPEDRAAMLRRCAGPPPRPMAATDRPMQTLVPAPVSVAERVEPAANSGG